MASLGERWVRSAYFVQARAIEEAREYLEGRLTAQPFRIDSFCRLSHPDWN